jgi:iron complex transport system substrate-binding protein
MVKLAAGAFLVWAAAAATAQNLVGGQCVEGVVQATKDYFPDKVETSYTKGFTVEYFKTYKVVTNVVAGTKYALYQCGTTKPTVAGANLTISVPVTSVALGDTTYLPRIEQLGERPAIKAYISNTTFITSPCVDDLVASGTIVQAFSANDTCFGTKINNTALAAAKVQATFVTEFGTATCGADTVPEPVLNNVVMSDNKERGDNANLATAEWLKYVAVFFNREADANAAFAAIEGRWNCTVNNAEQCAQVLTKPRVTWSPGYIAGEGWFLTNDQAYYVEAVEKAGGELIKCLNGTSQSGQFL